MGMGDLFSCIFFLLCCGVLRGTEDTTVTEAIFGNLFFKSGLAGADTVVRGFTLLRCVSDYHKTGTEAFSVDEPVSGKPHGYSLVHLLIGVLYKSELSVDLFDKLPGLLQFCLELIGVDIDLLHSCYPLSCSFVLIQLFGEALQFIGKILHFCAPLF